MVTAGQETALTNTLWNYVAKIGGLGHCRALASLHVQVVGREIKKGREDHIYENGIHGGR